MLTQQEIIRLKELITKEDNLYPKIFAALADKNRLHIFKLLSSYDDLCVTDIARIFDISIPAVSYHLKILGIAGLAERIKMGQVVCYRINKKSHISKILTKLVYA